MTAKRARKKAVQPSPKEVSPAPRRSKTFTAAGDFAALVKRVVLIIEDARARLVRTVNSEMVLSSYWHIGRRSTTDIVRREAEFPLCLFRGNDQRGFILQPGDAA